MAIINWLNNNKDNITFTINSEGNISFSFIGNPNLIKNKKDMLELIELDPFIIKFGSDELKNDPEIGKICIAKSPFSLKHLGTANKNNFDLVKNALYKSKFITNGFSLISCVGESIKQNREFILELIKESHSAKFFRFVSKYHSNDKELNLLAIKKGATLDQVDGRYKLDKDCVIAFVSNKADNYLKIPDNYRLDKDVVLASIKNNFGQSYKLISDLMKDDIEITVEALKINDKNIAYISRKISRLINGQEHRALPALEAILLKEALDTDLTTLEISAPKKAKI